METTTTSSSVIEMSSPSSSSNEASNRQEMPGKKPRVMRYCPKVEDIKFELKCEWGTDCHCILTDMDSYLTHIDEHLDENDVIICNDDESEKDCRRSLLECKWQQCDSKEFKCESDFKRHVRFHAFHTKLKQIGVNVLESLEKRQNNTTTTPTETIAKRVPKCNLDDQTRNSIPELPFKFECAWDACAYTTDNPELFYRHVRQAHVDSYSIKNKNKPCLWSQCEQVITNRNRLVEHMRHHSQEKLVACPNCGSLFSSFTKFIDHCSRSSEIGNLCYQCSHCNKIFSTNNLLKEHIRKHINKCKCPICDMTCIDKNDLSKHILYKHTNHKSFKCDYCDYSGKTQHDLQKHINLKHNERYEYQCNECDFKSKDLNSIKRHMLKFHLNGEGSLLVNDGQQFSSSYMCHVCNKIYSNGSTLSRHLKTHHNFQWPSGHSRFRYKLESDGYYRLQTMRYESIELVEELNKQQQQSTSSGDDDVASTSTNLDSNLTPTESVTHLRLPITPVNSVNITSNTTSLNDLTNSQPQPQQQQQQQQPQQNIPLNLNSINCCFSNSLGQIINFEDELSNNNSVGNNNSMEIEQENTNNMVVRNDGGNADNHDNTLSSASYLHELNSNSLHSLAQVEQPQEYVQPNPKSSIEVVYFNNQQLFSFNPVYQNQNEASQNQTTFDLENFLNSSFNFNGMLAKQGQANVNEQSSFSHQDTEFKIEMDQSSNCLMNTIDNIRF